METYNKFYVGDVFRHHKLGKGKVLKADYNKNQTRYYCRFKDKFVWLKHSEMEDSL